MTRLLATLAALALTLGAAAAEDGTRAAGGAEMAPAHVEGDEGWDGSAKPDESPAKVETIAESDKPAEAAAKPVSEGETKKPAEPGAESAKSADAPASAKTVAEPAKAVAEPAKDTAEHAKPSGAERKASESDRKLDSAGARPAGSDAPKAAQKATAATETRSEPAKAVKIDVKSDAKLTARPRDAFVVERASIAPRSKPVAEPRPRAKSARADADLRAAESPRPHATLRSATPRTGQRTAGADRVRDAETVDVAQRVTRDSGPVAGGILCGGGSKWRCNWIEREHDKFYKFSPGHNWTDQTMATDFCATNKQMRVASATRIKSLPGGCCGFTVVQVTCRR
ncbi:hypothetical protein [Hansschlegelia zhihuaiae]|uniref:Uncharacterized protein n=1 Tax=Hansschlegelia zhihuaiae TaxID=405005 RepID=A0A4Q0MMC0_9HYPH|nr:hypothetical protein [Hansschlegelia zhihuaiae]RXF74723.1 hypothetical protein EK403_04885 [Hansschlegelia zhihuaiae]